MNARGIQAEYVYSTSTLFTTFTLFLPCIMLKQITHATPTNALLCNLCVVFYTAATCFGCYILVSAAWRWRDNRAEAHRSYVEDCKHELWKTAFVGGAWVIYVLYYFASPLFVEGKLLVFLVMCIGLHKIQIIFVSRLTFAISKHILTL